MEKYILTLITVKLKNPTCAFYLPLFQGFLGIELFSDIQDNKDSSQ